MLCLEAFLEQLVMKMSNLFIIIWVLHEFKMVLL